MLATTERPTGLYLLWPRQLEATRLLGLTDPPADEPVNELLYGGQAGGGKSHLLRAIGFSLCCRWPGATVALFRRTYPEIHETHIKRLLAELPPAWAGYNAERREFRFVNGSTFEARYCERDDDVYRYQSAEWDALLVDEATHFSRHQIEYLRTRVRSTRPGWYPIVVYATNPGNLGHLYFKAGFVDAAPAGTTFRAPAAEGGLRRHFLRARLEDNPSLLAADPTYRQRLAGLADEHLRRALAEGDWDIFAGQVFGEWRRERHVTEPFPIPPDWARWRAVDFGYANPYCCLWLTRDPATGRIYVYREDYRAGLTDVEQARAMKRLSIGEAIRTTLADPAIWIRQPNGVNVAESYAQNGVAVHRASNDRLAGWQTLHRFLAVGEHGPGLQVFSTCPNLIRTLPALVYDPHRPEDVDTDGEDHAADALRYGLMPAARTARTGGAVAFVHEA
jgi:phage terminase large subunit